MNFKSMIGFGVAGNFAGHLEQAGEANDFLSVETQEIIQPKAIFPFYIPSQEDHFLSIYPLSNKLIKFPEEGADNLQIEPEIALICDLEYQNNLVTKIIPRYFTAYNDCSIRRPNANKICEKKNWGENTKGISDILIPISSFQLGSEIDSYRIACFHKRNGTMNIYGIDSPAIGYSYFHQKLLNWIIDRMNNQPDQGPMNHIASLIKEANYPKQAIISIGATRYTEFGESNFLQKGDTSIVVVYNGQQYSQEDIIAMAKREHFGDEISALVQTVV
ncbi:hypothetical protein EV697_1201 [Bisgaardia hudsonensis]|uniref:Valyl-tRNA synthetase n=1 Tax=Bisgaardia hudsonensis TaxID=109472 RepID=A0A4R2MTQ0_9PAST|nr:DUF5718 family protein [Bisgaardia hudsonensis]QLB13299.1 hypothetical protein A6A11_06615 [Bisgaardia hudsonensis]TCP10651.1 hypothetical protein EV697_1201 [Bisgaardia hudsonensis]